MKHFTATSIESVRSDTTLPLNAPPFSFISQGRLLANLWISNQRAPFFLLSSSSQIKHFLTNISTFNAGSHRDCCYCISGVQSGHAIDRNYRCRKQQRVSAVKILYSGASSWNFTRYVITIHDTKQICTRANGKLYYFLTGTTSFLASNLICDDSNLIWCWKCNFGCIKAPARMLQHTWMPTFSAQALLWVMLSLNYPANTATAQNKQHNQAWKYQHAQSSVIGINLFDKGRPFIQGTNVNTKPGAQMEKPGLCFSC